ncbi:MAG: hypothetical protein QGH20_07940 [Candidatus Latescibacteria bacterium]|nr:hypothetical protein [Candidatus Latescibacterota bacterium]
MRHEIRHIHLGTAAKTGALFGLVPGLVVGGVAALGVSLVDGFLLSADPYLADSGLGGGVGLSFFLLSILFAAGGGAVVCLLAAALYNMAQPLIGGLVLTISEKKSKTRRSQRFLDDIEQE